MSITLPVICDAWQAGAETGYVEELAAHVDAQMLEVSRSAGSVDSLRIAVLAALNIADECFRLRADLRESDGRTAERAAALAAELAEALEEK